MKEKAKIERDKFVQRRRDELQVADQPVVQYRIPGPKAPTEEERAAHSITHYPPEPWCEFCAMGRGKDDPHFRVDFDNKDNTSPIIACDFAQLRGDGEDGGTADSVGETLVAYDCDVGFTKNNTITSERNIQVCSIGDNKIHTVIFPFKGCSAIRQRACKTCVMCGS